MIDLSANGSTGFLKLKRNDKNSGGMKYLAERGADMTQVALYAIAALIVVTLAFTLYSQFTTSNKIKNHITNIEMLNTGIASLFESQGLRNYATINTNIVAQTNATPKSFKDGVNITNEWGGAILLRPYTLPGGRPNNTFYIADYNIPKKECVDIVLATYTNFYQVWVGGKTVKRATAATAGADAIAGCKTNSNVIYFTH